MCSAIDNFLGEFKFVVTAHRAKALPLNFVVHVKIVLATLSINVCIAFAERFGAVIRTNKLKFYSSQVAFFAAGVTISTVGPPYAGMYCFLSPTG